MVAAARGLLWRAAGGEQGRRHESRHGLVDLQVQAACGGDDPAGRCIQHLTVLLDVTQTCELLFLISSSSAAGTSRGHSDTRSQRSSRNSNCKKAHTRALTKENLGVSAGPGGAVAGASTPGTSLVVAPAAGPPASPSRPLPLPLGSPKSRPNACSRNACAPPVHDHHGALERRRGALTPLSRGLHPGQPPLQLRRPSSWWRLHLLLCHTRHTRLCRP